MNGAGNDFMVIDARNQKLDFSALAKKLCKLTGADGFMAIDHSVVADFKLHFYNSDGTRGEMCGNGARCICRYAHELGLVGDAMTVETDAGLVDGQRISQDIYRIKLNLPSVIDLQRLPNAAYVELGTPGVPHSVTEIPGLTWEMRSELRPMAEALRHNPAFPKGANANLYTWLDDTTIRILTFERGVEDYTLACGTGTGSTAAALWASGKLPGGFLKAENRGGILSVTVSGEDGVITSLLLEGPTEISAVYQR
jgi:diaminopimelate epimerase